MAVMGYLDTPLGALTLKRILVPEWIKSTPAPVVNNLSTAGVDGFYVGVLHYQYDPWPLRVAIGAPSMTKASEYHEMLMACRRRFVTIREYLLGSERAWRKVHVHSVMAPAPYPSTSVGAYAPSNEAATVEATLMCRLTEERQGG